MNMRKCILLMAVFLLQQTFSLKNDDSQLLFAIQVMRHGARTPRYSGDLALNTNWDVNPGELTQKGKEQSFQAGQKSRERLIYKSGLLPEVYDPNSVVVMSTEFNRTIETACHYMEGLYPEPIQKAPVSYNATCLVTDPIVNQPKYLSDKCSRFPIHVFNSKTNYLTLGAESQVCPNIEQLQKGSLDSVHHATKSELKPLYDELMYKFNADPEHMVLDKAHPYIDAYAMAKVQGMQVSSTLSAYSEQLISKYLKYYINDGWFADDKASRLASSAFFKYIVETFDSKMRAIETIHENEEFYEDIKLVLLAAHDTTISAFMGGIEQLDSEYPSLTSSIFVELHKKGGDYYLKWNYNDKYYPVGNNCNSSNECDLIPTLDYLNSRAVDDLNGECHISDLTKVDSLIE